MRARARAAPARPSASCRLNFRSLMTVQAKAEKEEKKSPRRCCLVCLFQLHLRNCTRTHAMRSRTARSPHSRGTASPCNNCTASLRFQKRRWSSRTHQSRPLLVVCPYSKACGKKRSWFLGVLHLCQRYEHIGTADAVHTVVCTVLLVWEYNLLVPTYSSCS